MAVHCEIARRSWESDAALFALNRRNASPLVLAMARNVEEISIDADEWGRICFFPDRPEARLARATKLRARGTRYRLLAECLFDPSIVAMAQACALELEAEAASIEKMEADGPARSSAEAVDDARTNRIVSSP